MILHGKKDTMIPVQHAQELKERCFGPCTFVSPAGMTHNGFNVFEDLILTLKSFMISNNLDELSQEEDIDEETKDSYGSFL